MWFFNRKSADDLFLIARSYEFGIRSNQDIIMAFIYHKRAGRRGHTEALHAVGNIYYYGFNFTTNPRYKRALKWFKKAAKKGFPQAQYKLGEMYRDGEGVSIDLFKSKQWFEQASKNGYTK